jgi:mono/diheme cytochrome c family protein
MSADRKSVSLGPVGMTLALLLAVTTMAAAARAQTAYKPDATPQQVTFAKDVAPILQEHCQDCHRAGAMAPMSLVAFQETRP